MIQIDNMEIFITLVVGITTLMVFTYFGIKYADKRDSVKKLKIEVKDDRKSSEQDDSDNNVVVPYIHNNKISN